MDDDRYFDDTIDEPPVDMVQVRVAAIIYAGVARAYGYVPPELRPGYDPDDPS